MIVLDTHIFLWMNLDQGRVPVHILNAVGTEAQLGISAISLWETAMLVQYGRVTIPDESLVAWLRVALNAVKLHVLPITPECERSRYICKLFICNDYMNFSY